MSAAPILVTPGVVCKFERPAELLARYEHSFVQGGIFLPGEMRLSVGQPVRVDIELAGRPVAIQRPGVVRYKRHKRRPGGELEAGVGIEFLSGRGPFFPFLVALSASDETLVPRARRYGVQLLARCTFQGVQRRCRVLDLSARGALVDTLEQQPLGTRGSLQLEVEGFGTLDLDVEVRRHTSIQTPLGLGLGLAFVELSPAQQRSLERLERFLSAAAALWLNLSREDKRA